MESQPTFTVRKVKLKLEQPAIMCSGRKKVECYYRGKVIQESDETMLVEWKQNGEIRKSVYLKEGNRFQSADLKDLKIIK